MTVRATLNGFEILSTGHGPTGFVSAQSDASEPKTTHIPTRTRSEIGNGSAGSITPIPIEKDNAGIENYEADYPDYNRSKRPSVLEMIGTVFVITFLVGLWLAPGMHNTHASTKLSALGSSNVDSCVFDAKNFDDRC